jgi:hypothetical protein
MGKERGDRKATAPGRRRRSQVGVERRADEESADRLRFLKGRLAGLDTEEVADLLGVDAGNGSLTATYLLMRLAGMFGVKDEGDRIGWFARIGRPQRKRRRR